MVASTIMSQQSGIREAVEELKRASGWFRGQVPYLVELSTRISITSTELTYQFLIYICELVETIARCEETFHNWGHDQITKEEFEYLDGTFFPCHDRHTSIVDVVKIVLTKLSDTTPENLQDRKLMSSFNDYAVWYVEYLETFILRELFSV